MILLHVSLRFWGVVSAALGVIGGCSGSDFTTTTGETDGGGSAGLGGSGGDAGSGASGGASGTTGGGAGSCAAPCGGGEYCNRDSGRCARCGDVARFLFGPPERLSALIGSRTGDERFPRAASAGPGMFFRIGNPSSESALWFSANHLSGGSDQAFATSVDVSGQSESGALELESPVPALASANFFFDRTSGGPGSGRTLYAGIRTAGIDVGGVSPLPAPFNPSDGGSSNYSLALTTARAFWMTDRSGSPELVTAPLGDPGTPAVVTIDIGSSGCSRSGSDATPWVSPDGSFMLLRSAETSTGCATAGGMNDLFVVVLDPGGQAAAPASPLTDVNRAGGNDSDPSMSRDLCWLYFAAAGAPPAATFDLFRAPRQ
jgi:hypothetical protein